MENGHRVSEAHKLIVALGGAVIWRSIRWLYDHRKARTKKAISTRLYLLEQQHYNLTDRVASLEFILHHRPRAPDDHDIGS